MTHLMTGIQGNKKGCNLQPFLNLYMNKKISRAIVIVSDKTGVVDFCLTLNQLGIEILSKGGTFKILTENNITAI